MSLKILFVRQVCLRYNNTVVNCSILLKYLEGIYKKIVFFLQNDIILRGKKHTALFQTYNLEKFFQRTRTCICTDIRKYVAGGGHICPSSPGANRVKPAEL